MKSRLFLLCVLTLGACATPYIPPSLESKPPPLWSGSATRAILPTSPGFVPGIKRQGDALIESHTDATRQGTIQVEIKYRDPFGKEITVPQGTPVHGQQFSLMQSTRYGYLPATETNLNANNDPIEWCFKTATESACIFWESESRARYISMGALSQRLVLGINASGMIGPMPVIVEGPANFGGPIINKMVLTRIDDTGVEITPRLKDGSEVERDFGNKITLAWQSQGELTYENYVFRAIRNQQGTINSAEVRLIPKN